MPGWLSRLLLHSDRGSESRLGALESALADTIARVRALEAEQLTVMTEWEKTRTQVLRHLQRVAQRQALDEQAAARRDPAADLSRQILTLKMRGTNG